MGLTPEHLAVLSIFREHNIRRGQYLPIQTLDHERLNLPRKIQENWDVIIKKLRDLGYIIHDPLGYGLTKKAHGYIYSSSVWPDSFGE